MGASLLLEHGTAFSVESVVDIQIFFLLFTASSNKARRCSSLRGSRFVTWNWHFSPRKRARMPCRSQQGGIAVL
ncbi:MAG: hypothetical protein IPK14_17885 [Blastocatellia bacterium]|nr:hypothetical protein [Blastocatellia bacterium]MBN8722600.1 hypothetical protein [Acidobacteriota bacterium]